MYRISATLLLLLSFTFGSAFAQGVGINTNTPHASAVLDVTSTTQGFLPPRMTSAERDAISTPAQGLMIYNTDTDCYNSWDGAAWRQWCPECIQQVPVVGSNSPVCSGQSLNLTASTISGATYSWTGPNGFSSSSQNPSIAGVTTAADGNYFLEVTVGGCTSDPVSTTVTVNETPASPIASNNGPLCEGENLNLSASTVSGATYSWTGPNAFSSSAQNPTISSVTAAASGTYFVTTSANGCTSAAASTAVTVSSSSTGSMTYNYTGAGETFTVPACVTEITIDLYGAQGGTSPDFSTGGLGGQAEGTLSVSPGDPIYVYVGQYGADGGWNGGGLHTATGWTNYGGGASDVRVGGTALADRIAVAGGGGGGALRGPCSTPSQDVYGGDGGPNIGSSGTDADGGAIGGGGGTQSAGGTGGAGGFGTGTAGSLGQGGTGYSNAGGGGGGYYGGGGGGSANGCNRAAGGGGSNYVGGFTSTLQNNGGVRSGNGQVIISW